MICINSFFLNEPSSLLSNVYRRKNVLLIEGFHTRLYSATTINRSRNGGSIVSALEVWQHCSPGPVQDACIMLFGPFIMTAILQIMQNFDVITAVLGFNPRNTIVRLKDNLIIELHYNCKTGHF